MMLPFLRTFLGFFLWKLPFIPNLWDMKKLLSRALMVSLIFLKIKTKKANTSWPTNPSYMWVASYSWWEKRLKMTVCNPFIEKTGNSADQLISRYLWRAIRTQIYEGWGLSVDQQVGYVSRLMSQGVSRQSHEKVPKKVTVMAITLWFDFILIAISFPWILMTGALLTWQSQAAFINEDTENSQRSGYSMWKGQGWESPSALGCGPSILAPCHLFFSPWLLTFSIHQICSPWMKNNHPWGCWEGRILCSEVKPKGAPKPHFAESTNNSSSASGWGKASLPSSLIPVGRNCGKRGRTTGMDRKKYSQDSDFFFYPRHISDLSLGAWRAWKQMVWGAQQQSFCSASSLGSDALVSYHSPVWDSYST